MGMGQGQTSNDARIIHAQKFVVVDESGKERAILGMKGNTVHLEFHTRMGKQDAPIITMGTHNIDGAWKAEYASIAVKGLFSSTTSISGESVTIYNQKHDGSISLDYLKVPALKFTDKSGMDYMSFSYDDKTGGSLEIRQPLGIEGAWEEIGQAYVEKRPTDSRIEAAFNNSLRMELTAPPFSDPFIRLSKDGRVLRTMP